VIFNYTDIWAKDITNILGYKQTRCAIRRHVDDEDKRKLQDLWVRGSRTHQTSDELWESKLDSHQNSDFNRQNQDHTLYITESGVYGLIFASKLPAAKEFKRWITGTVIPSIRRTGQYQNKELINRVQKLELENQDNKPLNLRGETTTIRLHLKSTYTH
jgi:anti-repressor protein